MKSMKLGMIWVLVGMGLALLLSVGVFGFAERVSAQDSTDPVFVGAGDIASCARTGDEATAKLLHNIVDAASSPTTVFTTGDNAYEDGTFSEYKNCYGRQTGTDPNWGAFKAITMPIPGNHEYQTAGASGYFDYFSATPSAPVPNTTANPGLTPGKGYYSYDLGSWHMISLNSNCSFVAGGGCAAGSDQVAWLKADLAAHSNACTLAYWHHPRFSSGSTSGGNSNMKPFWEALYAAKADVVLNGHVHNYERFAPQTPTGVADPAKGIREFVVGTGGYSLNSFKTTVANSQAKNAIASGVLKLTLHPNGYDWEFVPEAGKTFSDIGSDSCEPDGTTPTEPVPEPPTVISTSPATIAPSANVTATFSEDMMASSINGKTFKLFKKGSSTKIGAVVTYFPDDPATTDTVEARASLDPNNSLQSGVTYKAVVTTGAKDSEGNPLAQQYQWFFMVR
jgi:Bacterial Ig-like domain/Calcineurin-like phosphoesterase